MSRLLGEGSLRSLGHFLDAFPEVQFDDLFGGELSESRRGGGVGSSVDGVVCEQPAPGLAVSVFAFAFGEVCLSLLSAEGLGGVRSRLLDGDGCVFGGCDGSEVTVCEAFESGEQSLVGGGFPRLG